MSSNDAKESSKGNSQEKNQLDNLGNSSQKKHEESSKTFGLYNNENENDLEYFLDSNINFVEKEEDTFEILEVGQNKNIV